MKEQLPLPGVPPGEEQASAEATAETVLIFDSDDKIEERVVNVLRNLFWGPADSVRDNAFRNRQSMTDVLSKPIKDLIAKEIEEHMKLPDPIRALIAKEIQLHIKELKEQTLKSRGIPKGPRK